MSALPILAAVLSAALSAALLLGVLHHRAASRRRAAPIPLDPLERLRLQRPKR